MKKSSSIFILFLALGVFGIITTEMGIIGVLPQVADRFHISASNAGWLVSIFAFIVAVSGPFLTLLASGINRKVILLLAVLMFAFSNAVYAYTAHFSVMLAFRIIPALCHPVFFSVALATAARLVPAGQSGKAVTKVFSGITAGFAFGVPFTSYLADRLSLEAAFLFGAIISLIAFTGILLFLPSMPVTEKISFRSQLGILRKPALWLNIAAVTCLFAAMFSVYSYFAEYLGRVSHMVSFMLMSFGVIMIAGNFVFGALLYKNMKKTVILFPLLYTAAYLLIYGFGTSFAPMVVLVFVWGAVHSGGLIVSQTWLTAEAKEAPEFGNSLFVSFSNLGITIGTAAGGWFISHWGIHQLMWCGIMFALLAFGMIMGRLAWGKRLLAEA
ncbi:MFS transporter [Bacillus velezensis]|uniref:MFS transporter n=1 Tax=Bacillus velezensis TaxID=492670 RepID=UPI003F6E2A7F